MMSYKCGTCEWNEGMLSACRAELEAVNNYAEHYRQRGNELAEKLAVVTRERDHWKDFCAASRLDHEETKEQLATVIKERDEYNAARLVVIADRDAMRNKREAMRQALEVENQVAITYAKQVVHWIGKYDLCKEQLAACQKELEEARQTRMVCGLCEAKIEASMKEQTT